jgi:DNA repair exonuclease SbcCD ATPase subunit
MKILEFLIDFYSPSGFKLYDLKQRCKRLVERANYWSKVFFQEPYEWSLSEDIDDLNLFVKPVNLKNEDPYPVALLSAGERNRAARVLLFAQLEMIPPTKRVNFLFLDEIEANLDEIGIRAFTEVAIPKLKETFPDRSIVLVSHLKDIKTSEYLDHQWLAERRQRKTKLTVQPWSQRRALLS